MKQNDVIHNFRVKYLQELPEIGAKLWRMEHERNGADLIWLERADDNKTFAIAFKTIPQDHTGVFHILEHSVLNGSQKYPIKEPFVELIKSSMATFINAFTYPDKTMYPVCSRNPQDFLNLMDVYLDAVMNPLSITDPHAFRQEGWHYELDSPDGELRCNGVVYNEMKGAFASPDEALSTELSLALFPDNCYKYVSGGHPEHIPELTYENYLASHHRFYHPSNARIILDGDMDIDAVLAKIDSFIGGYDKLDVDTDIPTQAPVCPDERLASYEIGADEDDKNKAILAGGWVYGDYTESEKVLAVSVLTEALCGSNESPLSKAILDAGLAQDVSLYNYDGIQQVLAQLVIRNVEAEKREEIWKLVDGTLRGLAENGLDHKQLHGILSRIEFNTREKDYGGMPTGLVFAMISLESWLYGGDPAQNLCYDEKFASLRKMIDEGGFEKLLKEVFIDSKHNAKVCLTPSKTLGEEKRKAEAERCAAIKAGWGDADIEKVISEFKTLRERQETPDTPEQVDKLPKLKLSDIPEKGVTTPQNVTEVSGVTVLNQPLDTNGITYLDLYFSLADMELGELKKAAFLSRLVGVTATENHSALELSGELQSCLGRFRAGTTVYAAAGQTENATPCFTVKISMLDDHKADAVRLADEILNRSKFDDSGFIYNIVRQTKIGLEQAITMRGNSYAARRALAAFSAKGAVVEAMEGVSALRYIQETDIKFAEQSEAICRELAETAKKIFTTSRLTVSITGDMDEKLVSDIIGKLSSAPMGAAVKYQPAEKASEGFTIPAEIGFAAVAGNLNGIGTEYTGAAKVAAQLLTFDYLWNEIRVKGGAYGTNMSAPADGDISLTSYRDPSPARSLGSFKEAGKVLREFCESGESADKYIISTIANIEPFMTPRTQGEQAAFRYLSQRTPEDIARERKEILGTSKDDLKAFSEELDRVFDASNSCVIGGKNVIDACGLEKVEALQ